MAIDPPVNAHCARPVPVVTIAGMTASDTERPRPLVERVLGTIGGRRSPLLEELDPGERARFLSAGRVATYRPHDPIVATQAPDAALHVVLEGAAMQRWWLPGRSESYVRPVPPGQTIGLSEALGHRHPTSEVRALIRTVTLRVPATTVRSVLAGSRAVAAALARAGVRELDRAQGDVLVLRVSDVRTRVLMRLVELVDEWGIQTVEGVDVRLPITQEELGDWAGASRESTVKALHWMRHRGVIATSRRHIHVLDVAALRRLADTEA